MKKTILIIMAVMLSVCSMTSCNWNKEEQKAQPINASDNFNELVWKINEQVMANYPTFGFYEAYANLAEYDSTNYGAIDPATLQVVYGDTEGMRTVIACVDEDWNVCYDVVDEPWLEDQQTTPYVPMDLMLALELLQNEIDVVYEPGTFVVLRHQLYYREPEPRYFIGPLSALHTVNVYTGEIDAPLAKPTETVEE